MAYATIQDMIERFGEIELVRYTTPADQPADTINVDRVNLALGDASDLIDSFLRRHYTVPVVTPTASITRACCIIARCDLAQTSRSMPTDQQKLDRDGQISWLKSLSTGAATLDGAIAPTTGTEFAQVSDRQAPLSKGRLW